jgi:phosphoserine phosphatase RsbU/P
MAPIQLVAFAVAVVICAASVTALVGHALRPRPADRLLLWFGVFSAVYGIRMFFKLAGAIGIAPSTGRWVENGLNYFILIPALLFVEELYGQGWRHLLRWVTGGMTAFAVVALIVDIAARDPTRVPDPSLGLLVIVVAVVAAGAVKGYRPPPFDEWRVLLGGVVVFLLLVINEHAVGARVVPWRFAAEPIGFLIQLGCFGYIALMRVFAQDRQLAAVEQELRSARDIQNAILPRALPTVGRVHIAARYEPLAAVAGDFYDVVALKRGAVALLVADVSGHGIPAALIASMVKVAFNAALGETTDPAVVLARMNATLSGMFERSYVTAACVFLDPETRTMQYALAGHPSPLLVLPAGSDVRPLDERGFALGMFPSAAYTTTTVGMPAGARLIAYTDGVIETPNHGDDLFGMERLIAFARVEHGRPPAPFADALLAELRRFAHRAPTPHDDVTIVVVDVD